MSTEVRERPTKVKPPIKASTKPGTFQPNNQAAAGPQDRRKATFYTQQLISALSEQYQKLEAYQAPAKDAKGKPIKDPDTGLDATVTKTRRVPAFDARGEEITKFRAVLDQLILQATDVGEMKAIDMILDRTMGKVPLPQPGDDGEPVQIIVKGGLPTTPLTQNPDGTYSAPGHFTFTPPLPIPEKP